MRRAGPTDLGLDALASVAMNRTDTVHPKRLEEIMEPRAELLATLTHAIELAEAVHERWLARSLRDDVRLLESGRIADDFPDYRPR